GATAGYASLRREFFGSAAAAGGQASIPGPGPAPREPSPSEAVLDEFRTRLAPHQLNAYHPRTLSYFTPPPLVMSVLGELLAQVTQQGIDVWHAGPSGAFVEEEVIRWLTDLVGYPPADGPPVDGGVGAKDGTFGLLTSGGVMANLLAMTLVRDVHLPGLAGLPHPPRGRELEGIRVYTSDQCHFSIGRSLHELGFPSETLSIVDSDADLRMPIDALTRAIADDRRAGLRPAAVVAVAGSTNTGAVDPIPAMAEVAERDGLWLHVDAAYGGAARFSERLAGRVPDLHRADSVTVDPHKWFFQAYDIGALLVRRGSDLLETFHRAPEYYRGGARDDNDYGEHGAGELNFYQLGIEGTRRWRALKLWLSWKHVGSEGFARLVESNVDVASHLARQIRESDDFDAFPDEPPLSVVCFRHLPAGRTATEGLDPDGLRLLDRHQDRLQRALEASGDGWLSTTVLRGRTYLRAGIVNYMTTAADIDELLAILRRLAVDLGA
ncbi:MAG TPA: pyridoxal-dependent decarboxylase, partial [Candidatus Acidoferrum sp.]|nr:pyridoxal-dependent decarboxylase [Candidatus Acidoferrum sp.]